MKKIIILFYLLLISCVHKGIPYLERHAYFYKFDLNDIKNLQFYNEDDIILGRKSFKDSLNVNDPETIQKIIQRQIKTIEIHAYTPCIVVEAYRPREDYAYTWFKLDFGNKIYLKFISTGWDRPFSLAYEKRYNSAYVSLNGEEYEVLKGHKCKLLLNSNLVTDYVEVKVTEVTPGRLISSK